MSRLFFNISLAVGIRDVFHSFLCLALLATLWITKGHSEWFLFLSALVEFVTPAAGIVRLKKLYHEYVDIHKTWVENLKFLIKPSSWSGIFCWGLLLSFLWLNYQIAFGQSIKPAQTSWKLFIFTYLFNVWWHIVLKPWFTTACEIILNNRLQNNIRQYLPSKESFQEMKWISGVYRGHHVSSYKLSIISNQNKTNMLRFKKCITEV